MKKLYFYLYGIQFLVEIDTKTLVYQLKQLVLEALSSEGIATSAVSHALVAPLLKKQVRIYINNDNNVESTVEPVSRVIPAATPSTPTAAHN